MPNRRPLNPTRTIAALCVSGRSIYKHTAGVLAYDKSRDAKSFTGGMPIVAHPPCRCWSKFLSHQAKPLDRRAEIDLGLWCVEMVIENGGVLEQPAESRLFYAAGLPMPNRSIDPLLYTIYVEQQWFGYATPKPTWLLISGVPKRELPNFQPMAGAIGTMPKARSLARNLSQFGNSRTMPAFADFLCGIARASWHNLPVKHWTNDRANSRDLRNGTVALA